jgi:hypothetical protein
MNKWTKVVIVGSVALSIPIFAVWKRSTIDGAVNEEATIWSRMKHMNTSRLHTEPTNEKHKLDILLLVFGMKSGIGDNYETSILTLEHYRPHFSAMLYVSPLDTCQHPAFGAVPCIDCVTYGSKHRPDTRLGYKCIIDVAMSYEQMFPGDRRGFLFMHADFWLTPSFIAAGKSFLEHHPNAHWLPGGGKAQSLKCSDLKDHAIPTVGWWWDNSACGGQERCRVNLNGNWPPQSTAVERARTLHAKVASPNSFLKYTPDVGQWADLYFVPKGAYHSFQLAASSLREARVINELAVSMAMLASCDEQIGSIVFLGCWGGCCSSLQDPSMLDQQMCGHRLQLNDVAQVTALAKKWS